MVQTPPSSPNPRRRGKPAIAPAPRAAAAVAAVLKSAGAPLGPGLSEITARWAEIVGPRTAKSCRPIKLVGRGRDGVLHLAAKGPAALLVEAEAGRILERVNAFAGLDVAGRCSITRAPAQERFGHPGSSAPTAPRPRPLALSPRAEADLDAKLAKLTDPRLKAALRRLAIGLYTRDNAARP